MTVPEWFGIGVGAAGAAYLWWRIVRGAMWGWDENNNGANLAAGFFGGTVAWIFCPIWLPIWGAVVLWEKFPVRESILKAFPEPK